ncbi:hypothetical protein [Paludibacterium denitrificans]|uniref:Uncharacterized protein n=1 Tax=Paludibacterium denitrificans TaxID=2675226 RepID=A0A844GDQ8_9NEIS|nr:hypothetical protein [Paludibacterium denitrificans]MTD33450.1 hypothetical protein [Paludibacterium denitrificans]
MPGWRGTPTRETLKGGVMSKIKQLHSRVGNPDLSHWNDRKTFALYEAAMLTVGIDPLEIDPADWLNYIRRRKHPNWKHAAMVLRAMCEAICEGSMVVIKVYIWEGQFDEYAQPVDADSLELSDAGRIATIETLITRKALLDWYLKNGYAERKQNVSIPQKQAPKSSSAVLENDRQQSTPLLIENKIRGCTGEKIYRAISQFPDEFPSYSENPPPLDKKIRPWLQEELECDAREQHVLGKLVSEHFGLKKRT